MTRIVDGRVLARGGIGLLLACCLLAGCWADRGGRPADPDNFPERPIRVIVPFGPGGLADVTVRLAGEPLGEILGQRLVIENRPGAGGVAATSTMLNANPDGHTLMVLTNGTSIAESLFEDLPYMVTEDLVPVSSLAWFDLVLLGHPESGPASLAEAIDLARTRPTGLRIATINPGSTQNLTAELFLARAGIDGTIIPFRTTPDVLAALLREEVDIIIDAYTALKGPIDGGQARPLAVTGPERNPAMPEVPTALEAGIEDFVVTGWNALYAKAGTPPAIVEILNEAVRTVADMPAIQAQFRDLGVEARASTPAEIHERLVADIAKWGEVIESTEIETP